jgi:imidazolonepropionase-like amidohydrolase
MRLRYAASVLLIGAALAACPPIRGQLSDGQDPLALAGGQVYPAPGVKPVRNGVVLISTGKITALGEAGKIKIPSTFRKVDFTGKSLVAGLWNAHVHFIEPKWDNAAHVPAEQLTRNLQEMLTQYGFTSVVDTGSVLENTLALRRRIETGEVAGPRILTAGMILFPQHGLPYYVTESLPAEVVNQFREGEVAAPADAVRLVDKQIGEGADIVKLYVVSFLRIAGRIRPYPMPLSIIKAAAEEAHRKGKLVFAHPSTPEGVRLALDGNVDVLAHAAEEPERWNDSLAARLKSAHVTLIPTLTLFSIDSDFNLIMNEVKGYLGIGGQIMFGTDIGYLTDYKSLTKEFSYLQRAGLTFPQMLAALTTTPAARLGYGDRTGQIKPGMDADLTLLDGDPSVDADAFSRVCMTLRQGRIIYQAKTFRAGVNPAPYAHRQ